MKHPSGVVSSDLRWEKKQDYFIGNIRKKGELVMCEKAWRQRPVDDDMIVENNGGNSKKMATGHFPLI